MKKFAFGTLGALLLGFVVGCGGGASEAPAEPETPVEEADAAEGSGEAETEGDAAAE